MHKSCWPSLWGSGPPLAMGFPHLPPTPRIAFLSLPRSHLGATTFTRNLATQDSTYTQQSQRHPTLRQEVFCHHGGSAGDPSPTFPLPTPAAHPCGWLPAGRSGRRSWASAGSAASGAPQRGPAVMPSVPARRRQRGAPAVAVGVPPGVPWGRPAAGKRSRGRGARGAARVRRKGGRPSRGPGRGEPRWGCRRQSARRG